MAQLVKHSTRQNGLLRLQHLAAISLPSPPAAGNLINRSSERPWRLWQVWLPCKNLSSDASLEKFQETESSVEIKFEGDKSSNYSLSKVRGEVYKDCAIKENAGQPSYQKFLNGATPSLHCMKEKDAVPEEQGILETSTVAADRNVETSASARSPMKVGSLGKFNDSLKDALKSSLGEKISSKAGNDSNLKGHMNLNPNNSSNVPDAATTTSQSKKEWVRILSKYKDSENGQDMPDSAASESRLPNVQPKGQANLKLSPESEKAAPTPADTGFAVCVEQESLNIDVSLITELLSLYGDIEGSFRRMRVDGIWTTFVKFKTEEAKENALAARWVHIGGKSLPIRRVDRLMTTVVRISNASPEITENKVLSKCEAWGKVEIVKRRGKGIFDVYFKNKELPNMTSILDSLNSVILNHRPWKALPAPLVHPQGTEDLLKKRGGASWCLSQQVVTIDRMEAAIDSLMLDLQDLRELRGLVG